MPQAHYFRKTKSLFSTTLSSSISTGTGETITLASVSGLPTDTEITLTFDRVDSNGAATPAKLERITGIISGSNLTAYTRGVDGTTEQSHASGAVVECVWSGDDYNDFTDGILVGHDQAGEHIASLPLTTPKITTSINDANGNEVIKTPATSSAVNEITVTNAATGNSATISATGSDSNIGLDIKPKGTGVVRVDHEVSIQVVEGTTDTATGDGKFYFTIPATCNGMNLVRCHARVVTAGTTGTTDIQINNVTDGADMLSTKLTIDSGETGSDTAAAAYVIDATKDDVATNDLLRIDVDAVSSTAAKGLIVRLGFALP